MPTTSHDATGAPPQQFLLISALTARRRCGRTDDTAAEDQEERSLTI
jgi:hypothetical protein